MTTFPRLEIPAIAELARSDRWVCWRAIQRRGKMTKAPFTPAGTPAYSTDARSWSSYAECFQAAFVRGDHHGIGRVLTGDGLVAIDLDKCIVDGVLLLWAAAIVAEIASYADRSPSGGGVHVWARGYWPTNGNRRGRIEVYTNKRFLTVTGDHLAGTPETIEETDLRRLWERLLASRHEGNGAITATTQELCAWPARAPDPLPPEIATRLAAKYPQLRPALANSYPSGSERDLAVARFARLAGRPPVDAWALLVALRNDGKAARPEYAARTIARAFVQ